MKVFLPVASIFALATLAVTPALSGSCSSTCTTDRCPVSDIVKNGGKEYFGYTTDSCESIVGAGSHAYIKAGATINALDDSYLIISFPGASDAPSPRDDICYYRTTKPIGKTAKTTTDVQIAVYCDNPWNNCPIRLGADYDCFVPCCWTLNSGTQRYEVSCIDGTQRTAVVQGSAIGYTEWETGSFEQVNACPSTPATTTKAPSSTTKSPGSTPSTTPGTTQSSSSFVTKEYVRQSVSPSACDLPQSCSYMCSVGYKVEVVSDSKLTATPAVTNPTTTCSCYTLSATIKSDGTAVGSIDSTSYVLTKTSDGITVDATVEGVTCRGTYTAGTYTANKSSSSDASTMQTMVWATLVASVLAVTLASFGHLA